MGLKSLAWAVFDTHLVHLEFVCDNLVAHFQLLVVQCKRIIATINTLVNRSGIPVLL